MTGSINGSLGQGAGGMWHIAAAWTQKDGSTFGVQEPCGEAFRCRSIAAAGHPYKENAGEAA